MRANEKKSRAHAVMHLIAFAERRGQPTPMHCVYSIYEKREDETDRDAHTQSEREPDTQILQRKFRFGSTLTTFASFIL